MPPLPALPHLRKATAEDTGLLSCLNVQVWRETYRGLMPDGFLDAADIFAEREKTWGNVFKYSRSFDVNFLMFDEFHQPVGFAGAGPARDANLGFPAEVYTMYLVRSAQGRGWGRVLWNTLTDHLGIHPFYVWCHAHNPAGTFYQHMGGVALAERQGRWAGILYPERAYGFPAPRQLVR